MKLTFLSGERKLEMKRSRGLHSTKRYWSIKVSQIHKISNIYIVSLTTDPANADQIVRIQRNLDETREVLHQTIDSVLQRGEKLEDLVEKSGELSTTSKMFYKQAKKANSCCAVVWKPSRESTYMPA